MKKFITLLLLLVGCKSLDEKTFLNATATRIAIVDASMVGWAVYAKANGESIETIDKVRDAYNTYYNLSLAEKAAWEAFVTDRDLSNVEKIQDMVIAARKPLLNLILQYTSRNLRETNQPDSERVTLAEIQLAFKLLMPYEYYVAQ